MNHAFWSFPIPTHPLCFLYAAHYWNNSFCLISEFLSFLSASLCFPSEKVRSSPKKTLSAWTTPELDAAQSVELHFKTRVRPVHCVFERLFNQTTCIATVYHLKMLSCTTAQTSERWSQHDDTVDWGSMFVLRITKQEVCTNTTVLKCSVFVLSWRDKNSK